MRTPLDSTQPGDERDYRVTMTLPANERSRRLVRLLVAGVADAPAPRLDALRHVAGVVVEALVGAAPPGSRLHVEIERRTDGVTVRTSAAGTGVGFVFGLSPRWHDRGAVSSGSANGAGAGSG